MITGCRLERDGDGEIASVKLTASDGIFWYEPAGHEGWLAVARLAAAEERERLTRDLDARCDAYWARYKGYDGKGQRSASDYDQGASNVLEEAAQAYRRGDHWRGGTDDGEK